MRPLALPGMRNVRPALAEPVDRLPWPRAALLAAAICGAAWTCILGIVAWVWL